MERDYTKALSADYLEAVRDCNLRVWKARVDTAKKHPYGEIAKLAPHDLGEAVTVIETLLAAIDRVDAALSPHHGRGVFVDSPYYTAQGIRFKIRSAIYGEEEADRLSRD